ncbi:Na/Pi cotransporter II-like protein [Pullulanibacillus camelliae]|uniref:Na/Pi cotransporter II-like protein n=1 Tax=Pullulanibacillus camelliae TaxID=1707096 RepID=A0A8J2VJY6_9BACL|nr:Na/Pi cotransporter family protein [Pullulanibacillus camelliae]GGE26833.1 Na/Pi cotransporter II-like protein [Pullulanibacillus camelliae]
MLNHLLSFLTGVGLFIYGAHLLSKGLQRLAITKLRHYMSTFTNTRLKGLMSGFIMTCLMQSSTVTSIIVVGLVDSSVLSLAQALGVILGSGIGTTVIVQILTFNISRFSALFIFCGVILFLFIKGSRLKTIGQVLIGFGFVLLGIELITSSLVPLGKLRGFLHLITVLSSHPLLFVVISALCTAVLHNSAAMIMIGISFVTSGTLGVPEVLPLILGANVGATLPVFVSSLSASTEGKRVALSYMLFKCVGAGLCLTLLPWLGRSIYWLPGQLERQVANFHTALNMGIALLFLPFLPSFTRMIHKVFPGKQSEIAKRLNDTLLSVPDEALLKTKIEILQLAYEVKDRMIVRLPYYLEDPKEFEPIQQTEQTVDDSYRMIQKYLLKLGQQDLTDTQSDKEVQLLYVLNDIESIGDNVMQCLNLIQKSRLQNIEMPHQDYQILETFIEYIEEALEKSIQALERQDTAIAMKNIQSEPIVSQFEMDLKFNHFNRLIDKNEYNPAISAIYLDLINQLLSIYQHALNVSRTVLGLI